MPLNLANHVLNYLLSYYVGLCLEFCYDNKVLTNIQDNNKVTQFRLGRTVTPVVTPSLGREAGPCTPIVFTRSPNHDAMTFGFSFANGSYQNHQICNSKGGGEMPQAVSWSTQILVLTTTPSSLRPKRI